MATLTLTGFNRNLTEAEITNMNNYLSAEMTAGNTNGLSWQSVRVGVAPALNERQWTTSDSANAFISFCNTFDPAPVYTATIAE